MADEMLARLDQLQRGAREIHPRRHEHDAHSEYHRYDAYEAEQDYIEGDEIFGDENIHPSGIRGMQLCVTRFDLLLTM